MTKRRTRRAPAPPPSGAPAASPRADLLASVLIFAAAAAVFWPTVGFSFLNWDDSVYILENPWIRSSFARRLARLSMRSSARS